MSRRRYTTEAIIAKLREAEVEHARGQTVAQLCKKIGVSEQTYYRWPGGPPACGGFLNSHQIYLIKKSLVQVHQYS